LTKQQPCPIAQICCSLLMFVLISDMVLKFRSTELAISGC
jgi:hypothetical protein